MNIPRIFLAAAFGTPLLMQASCGSTIPSKASGDPGGIASADLSILAESIEPIRRAEKVGHHIFMEDVIAGRGTDVAIGDGGLLTDARRRGWIVTRNAECATVRFIGFEADQYVALVDVCFPWDSMTQPVWKREVRRYTPALPLPPDQKTMASARQVAIDSLNAHCSDRYNTILVPGDLLGNKGWTVYLLAATTEPDEIMFGGHVRVDVSEDGRTPLQMTTLSKSCLRVKSSKEMVSHNVTELVSDYPTEIHVYLSRLHRIPIYVVARSGVWKVEDGKIHWKGQVR